MSKGTLFTLRTGAVNFRSADGKKTGILYPIHPNDSDEVVKEKLQTALEVHAVAPEKFESISEEKIQKVLNAKPEATAAKALTGAAKAAADKKAKAEAEAKAKAEAEAAKTEEVEESDDDTDTDKDLD